jgi:hypothetical protein
MRSGSPLNVKAHLDRITKMLPGNRSQHYDSVPLLPAGYSAGCAVLPLEIHVLILQWKNNRFL